MGASAAAHCAVYDIHVIRQRIENRNPRQQQTDIPLRKAAFTVLHTGTAARFPGEITQCTAIRDTRAEAVFTLGWFPIL
jgi:hypothetical protein